MPDFDPFAEIGAPVGTLPGQEPQRKKSGSADPFGDVLADVPPVADHERAVWGIAAQIGQRAAQQFIDPKNITRDKMPTPTKAGIRKVVDEQLGGIEEYRKLYEQKFPGQKFDADKIYEEAARASQGEILRSLQQGTDTTENPAKYFFVERIPGVSSGYAIAKSGQLYAAAKRIENDSATMEDYATVARHLAEGERDANKSGLRQTGDFLTKAPAMVAEWMATGGGATAGRKAAANVAEKLAARALTQTPGLTAAGTVSQVGMDTAGKIAAGLGAAAIGSRAGGVVAEGLGRTMTTMGGLQIAEGVAKRIVPKVEYDAKGEPVVGKADGPTSAVFKEFVNNAIDKIVWSAAGGKPGTRTTDKGVVDAVTGEFAPRSSSTAMQLMGGPVVSSGTPDAVGMIYQRSLQEAAESWAAQTIRGTAKGLAANEAAKDLQALAGTQDKGGLLMGQALKDTIPETVGIAIIEGLTKAYGKFAGRGKSADQIKKRLEEEAYRINWDAKINEYLKATESRDPRALEPPPDGSPRFYPNAPTPPPPGQANPYYGPELPPPPPPIPGQPVAGMRPNPLPDSMRPPTGLQPALPAGNPRLNPQYPPPPPAPIDAEFTVRPPTPALPAGPNPPQALPPYSPPPPPVASPDVPPPGRPAPTPGGGLQPEPQPTSPAGRPGRPVADRPAPPTITIPDAPPPGPGESLAGIENPHARLADAIAERLKVGPITSEDLFKLADEIHGGTRAEGAYGPSQAYDSLETAVAITLKGRTDPTLGLDDAKRQAEGLRRMTASLPTQTNRSGTKDDMQQFSTPPDFAFAANWVANLQRDETVLEPSAGTASIAIHALNAGANVVVNEYDPARADLLKHLGFPDVTVENARHYDSIRPDLRPDVAILNPPFSNDADSGRTRKSEVGYEHVNAALRQIRDGGRVVAIVGGAKDRKTGEDTQKFALWKEKVGKEATILADVMVSGQAVYKKYGTSFDSRIIVIDKVKPAAGHTPITGSADFIPDLLDMLEGVRNARAIEPVANPERPQPNPDDPRSGQPTPGQPNSETAPDGPNGKPPVQSGAAPSGSGGGGTPTGKRGSKGTAPRPAEPTGPPEPTGSTSGTPERGSDAGSNEGRTNQAEGGNEPTGQPDAPAPEGTGETPSGDAAPRGDTPQPTKRQRELEPEPDGGTEPSPTQVFENYHSPLKFPGASEHPAKLVQSAALAMVEGPEITVYPEGIRKAVEKGLVSHEQAYEVARAQQMHEKFINIPKVGRVRQGVMSGHGTGFGKTRIAAGVILNNINQGRPKAVLISVQKELVKGFATEFAEIGGNADSIYELPELKSKVDATDGILFTTYSKLRGKGTAKGGTLGETRLDQVSKLIGGTDQSKWKDVQVTIVLDEAHAMGNASGEADEDDDDDEGGGGRGRRSMYGSQGPSLQAMAGIELQNRFPNARILYLSATNATKPENLPYMTRLGLWGEGTAFASADDLVNEVTAGGTGMMELVAQHLKAKGVYDAATLDMSETSVKRIPVTFTDKQRQYYDETADAWQFVNNNAQRLMENLPGGRTGKAAAFARKNFENQLRSAQLRFYQQFTTALAMPTVLKEIRAANERGEFAIVQFALTQQSAIERASQKLAGNKDAEVDLSPKQMLIDFIEDSFPVFVIEERPRPDGGKGTVAAVVRDSKGNPLIDQAALAARNRIVEQIARYSWPAASPIDYLRDALGSDKVAEMTGRTSYYDSKLGKIVPRVVMQGKKEIKNIDRVNAVELDRAMNSNDMSCLIYSIKKGGTGNTFSSSFRYKNQRKRAHMVAQPGDNASEALQSLGRSHRANQANAPTYYLFDMVELPASKRFNSVMASKLEAAGSFIQGERRAGGSGIFSPADNLETQQAVDALANFYRLVARGALDSQGVSVADVENAMGIKLHDKDGRFVPPPPVTKRYMNRLFTLRLAKQQVVSGVFDAIHQSVIDQATEAGTLDQGAQDFPRRAGLRKIKEEDILGQDGGVLSRPNEAPGRKVVGRVVTVERDTEFKPATWAAVERREKQSREINDSKAGFYEGPTPNSVMFAETSNTTWTNPNTGEVVTMLNVYRPDSQGYKRVESRMADGWRPIRHLDEAKERWEKIWDETPKVTTETHEFVTGQLLDMWRRIVGENAIYRVRLPGGERFMARELDSQMISQARAALGLGVDNAVYTPARVFAALGKGNVLATFASGVTLRPRRVANELRILITESPDREFTEDEERRLIGMGVLRERINYVQHLFLPMTIKGATILQVMMENDPIVSMEALSTGRTREADSQAIGGGRAGGGGTSAPIGEKSEDWSVPRAPGPNPPPAPPAPSNFYVPINMTEYAAGSIRHHRAIQQQSKERSLRALKKAALFFHKHIELEPDLATRTDKLLTFTDAIENNAISSLPADQREAAQAIRDLFEARKPALAQLGLVRSFIDDYIGHIWKDPRNANATPQDLGERISRSSLAGSENFRKARTLPTTRDGINAGLEPVTWNPIELQLRKLDEVDRAIFGHGLLTEWKGDGLVPFVRLGEAPPPGYTRLQDKLGTQWGPNHIYVTEFYDAEQRRKLLEIATRMGISVETTMTGGAGKAITGGAPGTDRIQRRFATPESVLAHELGHHLSWKYGLAKKWVKHPVYKQELRDLADQRFVNQMVTPNYQRYVRKGEEKIANLIAAYLYAPAVLESVAPQIAKELDRFLNSKPELRPLRDAKPSLVLGAERYKQYLQGPQLLGHHYIPSEAAELLDRFLEKGLTRFKTFRAFREFGNHMTMFQLGLSGFHATMTALTAQWSQLATGLELLSRGEVAKAAKYWDAAAVPLLAAGAAAVGAPALLTVGFAAAGPIATVAKLMRRGGQIDKEYFKPGSTTPETAEAVRTLLEGGGRVKMGEWYKGSQVDKVRRAFAEVKAKQYKAGHLMLPLRVIGAMMELTSYPLMEKMVPMVKTGVAADMIARDLAQLPPGASLEERRTAAGKVIDIIDERFGQVIYDNLFWHKFVKDGLMVVTRAVGWNYGSLQTIAGGIGGIPKQPGRLIRGEGLSHRSSFLIAAILGTMLIGAIMAYLYTGKLPEDLMGYFFVKTGRKRPDGSDERVSLPGYHKEPFQLANRADEGPARLASNLAHMAKAKLNGWIGMLGDALSNETFFGEAVWDPADKWSKQLKSLGAHFVSAYEPFAIRGQRQLRESGAGLTESGLAIMGVQPASGYFSKTSTEQRAKESKTIQQTPLEKLRHDKYGKFSSLLTGLVATGSDGQKAFVAVTDALDAKQPIPTNLPPKAQAFVNDFLGRQIVTALRDKPTLNKGESQENYQSRLIAWNQDVADARGLIKQAQLTAEQRQQLVLEHERNVIARQTGGDSSNVKVKIWGPNATRTHTGKLIQRAGEPFDKQ